jgi:hypothetical protein
MFADMRELKMGVGHAAAAAAAGYGLVTPRGGEEAEGDAEAGGMKKWLGLSKLWKEK